MIDPNEIYSFIFWDTEGNELQIEKTFHTFTNIDILADMCIYKFYVVDILNSGTIYGLGRVKNRSFSQE